MDAGQIAFLGGALTLPLVTMLAIGRAAWCAYRCRKAGRPAFALLSGLAIAIVLVVFAAVVVTWLSYAVAHSAKDAATDLAVLGGTGVAVYVATFGAWRACLFMENRLDP